jgi:hypothetical protein
VRYLSNKRRRLGTERAARPIRFQNRLTQRVQDRDGNIHAHLPCHQPHELTGGYVHPVFVGLSRRHFPLDDPMQLQLTSGARPGGVLSKQPWSCQELKDKDHPSAANENHRNWTGGYSIDESDSEKHEFLANTLWMCAWQIAESPARPFHASVIGKYR